MWLNLGDHAAHGGGVFQGGDPANAIEAKTDQGRALIAFTTKRAAGLADFDLSHLTDP